jgi:hypothetical protein
VIIKGLERALNPPLFTVDGFPYPARTFDQVGVGSGVPRNRDQRPHVLDEQIRVGFDAV